MLCYGISSSVRGSKTRPLAIGQQGRPGARLVPWGADSQMAATPPMDHRLEMSDADLVRAVADRDRAAFTALYRRYAPRVDTFLRKRNATGTLAAEVTQEVMLTVWARADTFDPLRASVASWIFTIVRSRYIDRIRKERRPTIDP